MQDSRFTYSFDTLQQISQDILEQAKKAGASACEAEVSQGFGQNVTVRQDEVETIEYNRDKGLGVTVYFGQRRGHASTSDLSPEAIRDTVKAACSIARHTASDEFAGLADEALLASEIPDLDLYHPWELPVEQAIALAQECEAAAMDVDKRINNSEGASVSTHESLFVYANSLGFIGGYPTSRHSISCAVMAGIGSRHAARLLVRHRARRRRPGNAAAVGRMAGERTVRRLDARKLKTMQVPVLFEAPIASGLIGSFVGAVSGGSLYRKSSFLLDSLGKEIFAPFIQLQELPHLRQRPGQQPLRRRRRGHPAATSSRTACCRAISSAAIRRASSA